MKKTAVNSIKLGLFVVAGLLFLMLMLYFIGQDQSLFSSTFVVKARFNNVQGLVPGNNVRYAGIEAGTVKRLKILCDTVIEVTMIIDNDIKPFIRNNAVVSIGSDGLMGNKIVNIIASPGNAPLVEDGDLLTVKKNIDMDEMLQTLSTTNNDVAAIAANLKSTVIRINNSTALWKLLNDNSIPNNLRASAANIQLATKKAEFLVDDLQLMVADIKAGRGSLGTLLRDTSFVEALNATLAKITEVGEHADKLATTLDEGIMEVRHDLQSGAGPANALLKDSLMVAKLEYSLDNIQKGTNAFAENMEALKHNFLFRGYFKKQEKKKQQQKNSAVTDTAR